MTAARGHRTDEQPLQRLRIREAVENRAARRDGEWKFVLRQPTTKPTR
ncbi:hypothetical protein ACFQ36_19005 [Arthrobacter sp. GCM10027362]